MSVVNLDQKVNKDHQVAPDETVRLDFPASLVYLVLENVVHLVRLVLLVIQVNRAKKESKVNAGFLVDLDNLDQPV